MVQSGTPLIALYGATAGVPAITYVDAAINQAILAMVPRTIEPEYLFQWLQANREAIIDRYTQGGQPNLSGAIVRSISLPLPPATEQRRIANSLRDVDDLIAALERLITKKQAIKLGMMQELLTGRTRLPGFTRNWVPGTFEELASPVKDRTLPGQVSPDTPLVELDQIESATGRLLTRSTVTSATSLKTRFNVGDVLFGKLRAYLRKFWIADTSGLCTTEIWALRPKPGVSGEFVRFVVETDGFIEVASGAYGTHMPRSDWGTVRRYELLIPEPEEQTAIASILMDADREVQLLRARLAKARDIKQGMMQELLTGRTRLPLQEAVV
jgi:type I restriction enzyme S subunit